MRITNIYDIPSGKYCRHDDLDTDERTECGLMTCTTSMDPHFMCDLFRQGVYSDPVYDDIEKCPTCKIQFSLGAIARETYEVTAREDRHASKDKERTKA